MPATLQFVDSIASSPSVRLNLNSAPWKWLAERTDFTPPPLRRAIADSGVLRDGSEIPASAFDNRVVTLALLLDTTTQDTLGSNLQTLNRELNRPRNILKFQPDGATNPVFFRTFRSPDYELDVNVASTGLNKATVVLRVVAEPFAYGLRVELAEVNVKHDPAAASNGCFLDVTGVLGDVDTPAFIQVTQPVNTNTRQLWAIRKRGTPADLTFFRQAESGTMGNDTVTATDAGASGGSIARTSGWTVGGMSTRVTLKLPKTGMTANEKLAALGTYRVFAVVRKTVSGDAITVQMTDGSGRALGPVVTPIASTTWQILDLGLVQIPRGVQPLTPGYSGITPGAADTSDIQFRAERASGTGNLEWDFMFWLPADEGFNLLTFETSATGEDVFIDGPNDAVYLASDDFETAGTQLGAPGAPVIKWTGSLLALRPNQTNRLFLVAANNSTGEYLKGSSDIPIIVHYWPRYLYVRGA